ncbi:MAG: DNA repair protein RecO [Myxococcota bacterium]
MNVRRSLELVGLVLGTRDFSDSHRIVDLLTPEEGRLSLLARGGRASKRRFAGALDLFVTLRVQVSTGGNLWTLTGADVLDARVEIRKRLEALARASLLAELTRALAPEHQAAPELFGVASEALDRLNRGEDSSAAAAYPALLSAAGVLPELRGCARCGVDRAGALREDGFVCTVCVPTRRPMSDAVRAVWQGAPCDSDALALAVEDAALDFSEAALGVRFKSRHLRL